MRGNRGFSFIEIALSIAILALTFAAFSPVFTQGIAFTKDIRDYSILVNLGEELIHNYLVEIRSRPVNPPLSFYEEDITARVLQEFPNPVFKSFQRFTVFGTVRPSLLCDNNGYEIIVRILWETAGRKREFSLFSAKAVREP